MGFDVEVLPRQPEKLYRNVTCDGCGCSLMNAGPNREDEAWEYLQPNDTLVMRLDGGYGMAIDPCCSDSEQELNILFCGKCTVKLCEQWPAIAKTVKNHVSSSLGHHCNKEREFVWRSYSNCCYSYCSGCGRFGGYSIGLEDENDRYSRRIVNCLQCMTQAPGLWMWERPFTWYVYYEPKDEEALRKWDYIGPFDTEEEALVQCNEVERREDVKRARIDRWLKL